MQANNATQTGLAAEIKIIPTWAYVLAALAFIAGEIFFNVFMAYEPDPLKAWIRAGFGTVLGFVVGCYMLALGYINRDAQRRGMSPILWTLVALLIPNGLGILLYFVLRQRLPYAFAPASGPAFFPAGGASAMEPGCCPRCGYQLTATCPHCRRLVATDEVFCKHCGASLHTQTVPA
jgi:hypothetical protein